MKTPEAYEKSEVSRFLASIGAYVIKPATGGFGASGHPDFVACYCGRFIGIEVKREGKEPTVLQERRLNEIQKAGGIGVWGTAAKIIGELNRLIL
jgi:Holliday junction resolvase